MILFTPMSALKIWQREKTVTSRLWLTQRAKVGSHHWAQLNMRAESRFARILITKVWIWDGRNADQHFAKKEGFDSPTEFLFAYWELNAHKWEDERRKHYAIEFQVEQTFEPTPPITIGGTTYHMKEVVPEEQQMLSLWHTVWGK